MGFKSEASCKVCTRWKDSHMFAGMREPRQQIHLRHREAVSRLAYIDDVPKCFMSAYGLIMWHMAQAILCNLFEKIWMYDIYLTRDRFCRRILFLQSIARSSVRKWLFQAEV